MQSVPSADLYDASSRLVSRLVDFVLTVMLEEGWTRVRILKGGKFRVNLSAKKNKERKLAAVVPLTHIRAEG